MESVISRVDVEGSRQPNFFGCWTMEDTSICDRLVDFFEENKDLQNPGVAGSGKPREAVKKSTDITIKPFDLENEKHRDVSSYIEHLKICYLDYLEQWEFLKSFMPDVHIGQFNLQKYDVGGHFSNIHSERTSLNTLHRTHVWMSYLNDVPEGGETEFPMFGLKVKPEKGKTLIWPAEWTHAHFGSVVTKGNKYIITGWMYPPVVD